MPESSSLPSGWAKRPRWAARVVLAAATSVVTTAGCGVLSVDPTSEVQEDLTVSSPVLVDGEPIPERFTCHGEGVSPPVQWSGFPAETESIAIVMDAPQAPGGNAVHWMVFDLNPEGQEISEGQPGSPAAEATNSLGSVGYEPPCPEEDGDEEYRFTVYALSSEVSLGEGAEFNEATDAIAERVLAYGRLVATGPQPS